jgi:alkylation response protein AidB-like acyl-CoA dehydrogenase
LSSSSASAAAAAAAASALFLPAKTPLDPWPGGDAIRVLSNGAINVQTGTAATLTTTAGLNVGNPGAAGTDFNIGLAQTGNGFALEYEISRVLCDARILNIFEGAAEIQAQVIARRLLDGAN